MASVDTLARLKWPTRFAGAPFGADLIAFVSALQQRGGTGLYVTRDDTMASAALKLAEYIDPKLEIVHIPGWDILPYDRVSPSPDIASKRCAGLARLAQREHTSGPLLVVTTASSIVQRLPPIETMRDASLSVSLGETVSQDRLVDYLKLNGYIRTATVRDRGDYAIRGGIVDIYGPHESEPIRLDFFGDTLEALRTFDPETQRSSRKLKQATFAPVSEILFTPHSLSQFRDKYLAAIGSPTGDPLYESARAEIRRQGIENWLPLFHESLDTLFDYAGPETLYGFSHLAQEAAAERLSQARDYYEARLEAAGETGQARVLKPSELYLAPDEFETITEAHSVARFSPSDATNDAKNLGASSGRNFAPERALPEVNVFEAAITHARALHAKGLPVVFAAWTHGSAERLTSVLRDHGLEDLQHCHSLDAALKAAYSVAELPLETGFETETIAVISEPDILGDRLAAPRRKRKAANFITEAATLSAGDLIVHIDHGVGRYCGLKTLDLSGAAHDCLELEYAGGDRIFLPVENIDLISRYGSEDATSAIDRLGGVGWQTRKARAKKRILEMAAELMQVAAARALKKADTIDTGEGLYEEFAARFPYEETDDQLNAIADVLTDLQSGRPMDRLVCGDVGFGKTEVALRGAFMAALSGKQVVIIAPTTLLARQHFKTFTERFAGWPVNIGHLSRLVPAKQAALTRAGLTNGTVDIVIGTHALLAKSIEFKRLGLVIVDEEQRFGVRHKERLKELKADVHVLTLSATPIPRTLQMALTGIRDLSIIATPPVDRLAVRTYVTEFDTVTIREALLREKYRGGQAFFVAPRIADLDRLETFLKDNVEEISFTVAHGQMGPVELEDIMTAFYEGEYDVLLSTTIVESGLDIPRANTLIIHRADRFGLAQLYQLRGRVGRSKLRAYAYFTTPRDMMISELAERRLRVLQSLDSLGAGFQLASHDLDMRGSGNLLGEQQSGQVREVGVELYQSMLEDAVSALRAGENEETLTDNWSPTINLGSSVLIPETYVEDLTTRLSLYRRLADIETEAEMEAIAAEMIDRFGALPEETEHLLEITSIKTRCKALGISKLDAGPKGILLSFRDDTPLEPVELMALVRARPTTLRLRPDSKLVFTDTKGTADQRMVAIKGLMSDLDELLKTSV